MTEQSIPETGRVVWHDLMTTDAKTSEKFFTELFGWQVKEMDMGPPAGVYRMLSAGGTDIGGIVPMEKPGIPSHWISYVSVEDVDAAVKRATGMGGTAAVPTMDIPNVGRFAVVGDPGGAFISPFKSAHPHPEETDAPPAPGTFCWEELMTHDPDTSVRFYGELFGWTTKTMPIGDGEYTLFCRGPKETAGCMKMPPEAGDAPAHWVSYVAVEDVDATAAKATELGGKIFVEPRDIPDKGRFSIAADPTGAMFAFYKSVRG